MAPDPDGPDDRGPDDPFAEEPDEPGFSIPGVPPFDLAGLQATGIDLSGIDLSAVDPSALARLLASSGPLNWEVATQLATAVATGGAPEPETDAASREQLEELARAAQTHVVAETGLAETFAMTVRSVGRSEWATIHVEALRPVLEALATTLGQAFQLDDPADPLVAPPFAMAGEPLSPEAMAAMLPALAPLLLGVQAGSMIGYLAQHALGRYDLPLPTSDAPSLVFVVRNLDEFEQAWSLSRADLRFYVAIHEVVHAAIRSVPWIRERLVTLAVEYVTAYELESGALEARLGDVDPNDPASLQQLAEHPEEILGAMSSERQRAVLEQLRVLHAALEGYADTVLERIGGALIPSFGQIHEAMARHRIERGEAERFVEGLLGMGIGREDYDLGRAFCAGVVERAGPEGLNRLLEDPSRIPTPNELRAAGLWLARIDLESDGPASATSGH